MSLNARLQASLDSRRKRNILRRLPDPTTVGPNSTGSDFYTNDYLSLASSKSYHERLLKKLQSSHAVAGSGGSRLLVNSTAHATLEARLATFFQAPAALLFNSGFDANVGFFACIPGEHDFVLYDEAIHASVYDGMRASRARDSLYSFKHNSVESLDRRLSDLMRSNPRILDGTCSVFIAVESLYSMDGDFAPLLDIVQLLETSLPHGNGHLIVDEAHATGIYGPEGRGLVAMLGLEKKVTARLHTFGKALACTGAVLLTSPLIYSYLLNYARPLIYTTALNHACITAIDTSLDILTDGTATQLSTHLLNLFDTFLTKLAPFIKKLPPDVIHLPQNILVPSARASPIIPVMTSKARPLSAYLNERGFLTRPIVWPTVPKGADRVRICLHAGNTVEEIDSLVGALLAWAQTQMQPRARGLIADAKL
ncbi:PLP-dependent transferase [Sistotremastrum niveocremeum HHB9708]|uniref:PLP-dependent transferase n=1 Tax=Sistotremastrum niveocremeum HHB9708 TaxID=1314777 RepID=A0A164VJH0_9AGAM|nr:PLP-dependent transferase [Sistotremastrum niveocremeum HHB9708]